MYRLLCLLPISLCAVLLAAIGAAAQSEPPWKVVPKATPVIRTFDYKGVRLTDSRWRRQMDEVRDAYLSIPNDDLLKGFRRRTGRPAPGMDLGGWYGEDKFHVFGQIISGLSRMYAATGDPACRGKVDALIDGWAECVSPGGYSYYSPKTTFKLYTYEKMACGLVDAHIYAGNKRSLLLLSRITDWAVANIKKPLPADEWYTLTENLYRAYLLTGDTKYLRYGEKWEHPVYWGRIARGENIFGQFENKPPIDRYHAYSHVNTFSGAAMAYLVKGDRHYLETCTHAYDYLHDNQMYATGGYGPMEGLWPPETLPATLENMMRSFEAQCGSWAGFKLSKYLMAFTGDARYGDWTERLLINGIGASVPTSPKGEVYYYANYNIGGAIKEYTVAPFPCCAGTRIQAIADYADLIYLHDDSGLYVNLFVASTVDLKIRGTNLRVEQATRFPESDSTSLSIHSPKPVKFTVRVRVPGWLAKPMSVSLNGKPIPVRTDERHWAVFDRTWREGDVLRIRLPMGFGLNRYPESSPQAYPAAVMFGPVVMAFRADSNPARRIKLDDLDHAFVPAPGEALTYHVAGDSSILARPYYAHKQGETYFMYLQPERNVTNVLHGSLPFTPGWRYEYDMRMTDIPGESVEYSFEGTRVRWLGCRHSNSGMAEVSIDGGTPEVVDQFVDGRRLPLVWESRVLTPGKHTIKITCLGRKNPKSKGTAVNVWALAVIAD